MSQENHVVLVSTTTKGYLYTVYDKEDLDRKKILYTGQISDNPKDCYCDCMGWSTLKKCYHQSRAKAIMEVKI